MWIDQNECATRAEISHDWSIFWPQINRLLSSAMSVHAMSVQLRHISFSLAHDCASPLRSLPHRYPACFFICENILFLIHSRSCGTYEADSRLKVMHARSPSPSMYRYKSLMS
eukprot:TRINITY_DN15531_c0_g1_i8.p1 TRINITY_DN15531_c0_g1~~TRINITY_DN15531_c0_g1_i8.p1  ORF type:complete len:113 (-),score=0.75 TRINITY_DN15531_c0_g1_i8:324-662(-)